MHDFQLRESLLRPDARISPGYGLVTVTLRNGQMVRGFARSRSNFDVALQDLTGLLRPVHEHEIASIREESHSYMPPVKASSVALQGLAVIGAPAAKSLCLL